MEKTEKVARLLEDFIREDDKEKELFPSLKRIPKSDKSWEGFVFWAKKLLHAIEE